MARIQLLQIGGQIAPQSLFFADHSMLYIKPHGPTVKLFFKTLDQVRGAARNEDRGVDAAAMIKLIANDSWSFDLRAVTQFSQVMMQISLILSRQSQVNMPEIGPFSTTEWDFEHHRQVPVLQREAATPFLIQVMPDALVADDNG